MSITATMRGQELTVRVDLPEHVQLPAITKAIQDAIENHPKLPKPGEVARDAYIAADVSGASDNQSWAAAEAAAREGYVSKAECVSKETIRQTIEAFNSYSADLGDALGLIEDIRELVK